MSCAIIPIENEVESNVFREALEMATNYNVHGDLARAFAIEMFRFSQHFEIESEGYENGEPYIIDVLNFSQKAVYKLSSFSRNTSTELSDFSGKSLEELSGSLNYEMDVRVKALLYDLTSDVMNFSAYNVENFTANEIVGVAEVLSSLFLANKHKLENIKFDITKEKQQSIKSELYRLFMESTEYHRSKLDQSSEVSDRFIKAFQEDYVNPESVLYSYFQKYFEINHNVTLKEGDTELNDNGEIESDMVIPAEWHNENQAKVNRLSSVSNIVKQQLAQILANINDDKTHRVSNDRYYNSVGYIPRPITIGGIWNRLSNAHRYDTTADQAMATINRLAEQNEAFLGIKSLFEQAEEPDNNEAVNFRNSYMGSVVLSVHPVEVMIINKKHEVGDRLNNRESFAELFLFDQWKAKILQDRAFGIHGKKEIAYLNVLSSKPNKGIDDAYINKVCKDFSNKCIEAGLVVSQQAFKNYLDISFKDKAYENIGEDRRKVSIISSINDMINFVLSEVLVKNPKSDKFDERGNLLNLASIASFDFNTTSNLSFESVTGELNHSPQYHSFVSKMFNGLVDRNGVNSEEVIRIFKPYTEDITLQSSNILWADTDSLNNGGRGIFNYTIENGIKVPTTVNMAFIKNFTLFQFEGVKDKNNGTKYSDLLGGNWDLAQTVNAIKGKFMIPSGDSPRSFGINIPLVNTDNLIDYESGAEEYGESGIGINTFHPAFQMLRNILDQGLAEFMSAKSKLFDANNEVLSDREIKHLHNKRYIGKVDRQTIENRRRVDSLTFEQYVSQLSKVDQDNKTTKNAKGRLVKLETAFKELKKLNSGTHGTVQVFNDKGDFAGRSFQFMDLQYKENNKEGKKVIVKFKDFVKSEENIKSDKDLLSLTEADFRKHYDDFLNKFIVSTVESQETHLKDLKSTMAKMKIGKNKENMMNHPGYMKLDGAQMQEYIKTRYAEMLVQDPSLRLSAKLNNELQNEYTTIQESIHKAKINNAFLKVAVQAAINHTINSVEINNLISGRLSEYKSIKDKNKRDPQVIKNGFNSSPFEKRTRKILITEDIELKNNIIENLKRTLKAETIEALQAKDATTTDAICFITDVEYKRLMLEFGRFTKDIERIYDKFMSNEPMNLGDYKTLIQQLKLFGHSRKLIDGEMNTRQEKSSTHILFKRNNRLLQTEALYDFMIKNKIDQITFSTAFKVGGVTPTIIADADGNFVEPMEFGDSIVEMSVNDFVIQQDVPDHLKDSVNKEGIQIVKKSVEDMRFSDRIYELNGKKLTGSEMFKAFQDIHSENVKMSAIELLNELGAYKDGEIVQENGKIKIDKKLLRQTLLRYALDDGQASNITKALRPAEDMEGNLMSDTPVLSFSTPMLYNYFSTILLSKSTSRIIEQKLPGIHISLLPNTFMNPSANIADMVIGDERMSAIKEYSDKGYITYTDQFLAEVEQRTETGKRKDFTLRSEYYEEDGTFVYADCVLNPWQQSFYTNLMKYKTIVNADGTTEHRQYVDINLIPENARKMFGYRTPTEGKQSTTLFKVVGFLNNGASQGIFPYTLITRTGWDFDIDSLYIMHKNLEWKNGKYDVIQYNDNIGEEGLIDYYKSVYSEETAKIYAGEVNVENEEGAYLHNSYNDLSMVIDEDGIEMQVTAPVRIKNFNNDYFKNFESQLKNSKLAVLPQVDDILSSLMAIKSSIARSSTLVRDILEFEKDYYGGAEIEQLVDANDEIKWRENSFKLYEANENINEHMLKIKDLLDRSKTEFTNEENISNALRELRSVREAFDVIFKQDQPIFDFVEECHTGVLKTLDHYARQKLDEYNMLSNDAKNSKKARENRIIEMYESIMSNPAHFDQVSKPNEFGNIQDVFDELNIIAGLDADSLNPNNLSDSEVLNNMNMSTRGLKGIAVGISNTMTVLGTIGARFETPISRVMTYEEIGKEDNDATRKWLEKKYDNNVVFHKKGTFKVMDTYIYNDATMTWTDLSGDRISKQSSELISHIRKAIMNPSGYNINKYTLTTFALLTCGITTSIHNGQWNRFAYAANFIHQPILVDLIQTLNLMTIDYPYTIMNTAINETVRKYQTQIYLLGRSQLSDVTRNKYNQIIINETSPYMSVPSKLMEELGEVHGVNIKPAHSNEPLFTSTQLRANIISYENDYAFASTAVKMQFLIDQLNILNNFRVLNMQALYVSRLGKALKTEVQVGPTFEKLDDLIDSISNLYLSRDNFAKHLRTLGLSDHRILAYLGSFDRTSSISDRRELYNHSLAIYKKDISNFVDPISDIYVMNKNGKKINIINAIFPGEFSGYYELVINKAGNKGNLKMTSPWTESAYGIIEARYQYGHKLAHDLYAASFLQRNDSILSHAKSMAKGVYGKNKPLAIVRVTKSLINYHIVDRLFPNLATQTIAQIIGSQDVYYGYEYLTNEETKIAFGDNKYDKEVFRKWNNLSLVNKLQLVRNSRYYRSYINNPKFADSHILKHLDIPNGSFEKFGYFKIQYRPDSRINSEMAIDSLTDMYNNLNPFIADLARDLIVFAYITTGFDFGYNISRIISPELLSKKFENPSYNKALQSIGLTKDADITNNIHHYAAIQRDVEAKFNLGELSVQDNHIDYAYRQLFDTNIVLETPLRLASETATQNPQSPTFQNIYTLPFNKDIPVVLEHYTSILGSKYEGRSYIRSIINGQSYLLKASLDLIPDVIVYYPINKLMPFEYSASSANPSYNLPAKEIDILQKIKVHHANGYMDSLLFGMFI